MTTEKITKNALLIFAKAPVAGQVKTRMRPLLSAAQSALLHRRLVLHCLATVTGTDSWWPELWVGSEHPWLQSLAVKNNFPWYVQQGSDLGERMSAATTQVLARADKVVVIGTDCPDLNTQYIAAAFAALDNHDVVIGPAADGGYVLIGLNAVRASLFVGINWGSAEVLLQTRQRIVEQSLASVELPVLMDIDRPEDFLSLQQRHPGLGSDLESEPGSDQNPDLDPV